MVSLDGGRIYEWADIGLDADQPPAFIKEMADLAMQRAARMDGVTLGPATFSKKRPGDLRFPKGLALQSDHVLWCAEAVEVIDVAGEPEAQAPGQGDQEDGSPSGGDAV